MRCLIFFLIAFITMPAIKAQQKLSKQVRTSFTLSANNIKGTFRITQLPTAKEVLLVRKLPVEVFPTDSVAQLTWATAISEPVVISLMVLGKGASASQKIYLQPGDSLSLVFNENDTSNKSMMMDTLHSKAGRLNNALAWYEYTTTQLMEPVWERLDNKTATLSFLEKQLQTMESIYATAKQLAGKSSYLETLHAFSMLNVRYTCSWYYDENKITPALPASFIDPAYNDKAFALVNNPVFVKYVLPEEVRRGFFYQYDWMIRQRFKAERVGMNDSTKVASMKKEMLRLSPYIPFRELAQYWYVRDVYFPYLQAHYPSSQLATARKMATTAASEVKDTAFQNHLRQQIATMGNILPGSPGLNFALEDHTGKIWHFSDLKGKVVYVDVWTTWCGPCRAEAPIFEKMAAAYAGKGVVFLGISADRPKDKPTWVEMAGHKQTLQLYSGEKTAFMQYYQVPGYPTFLLFDKEGKVVSANAPRPSSDSTLRAAIEKLL